MTTLRNAETEFTQKDSAGNPATGFAWVLDLKHDGRAWVHKIAEGTEIPLRKVSGLWHTDVRRDGMMTGRV